MKKLFVAAMALLASTSALADITATYKIREGGDLTISYRDDNHVRMDVPGNGYALLIGEKLYLVSQEGGQWIATDLSQMQGLMANMPFSSSAPGREKSQSDFSFVDTGKEEVVAGYTGSVFEVTQKDSGKRHQVVLTDHDDVVDLYKGLLGVTQKIIQSLGAGSGMPDLPAVRGGLLRRDADIVLTSLDKSDKGKNYFALPAGVKVHDLSQAADAMKNMPMPSAQDMQNMDPSAKAMMEKMMKGMQR